MLQQLRPNAELDLLTQDELRSVVTESRWEQKR